MHRNIAQVYSLSPKRPENNISHLNSCFSTSTEHKTIFQHPTGRKPTVGFSPTKTLEMTFPLVVMCLNNSMLSSMFISLPTTSYSLNRCFIKSKPSNQRDIINYSNPMIGYRESQFPVTGTSTLRITSSQMTPNINPGESPYHTHSIYFDSEQFPTMKMIYERKGDKHWFV